MNDHATKRKIIEVTNAEEPANSKKPKIESKEVDEVNSKSIIIIYIFLNKLIYVYTIF